MKLKDYLLTLDSNTIVSIGTKDGSSYMYIGEAGNTDLINKAFEDIYKGAVRRLKWLRSKEKNWFMMKPIMGKKQINDEALIHEYAGELAHIYEEINRTNKIVDRYVNPLTRDVVSTTELVRDDNGIQVIISGFESGRFWFKSEFDKRYG